MPDRLTELDPAGLDAALSRRPALVLPIGTIEWHSHHLPLGLDGIKAEGLGAAIADRAGAVLGPTTWWAAGGVPYPATLRLPGDLIGELLRAVALELVRIGFRALVLLNGHYGLENTIAVRQAAVDVMRATGAAVHPVAEYELLLDRGAEGDHAGVWETSLLWAVRDDLVRLDAVAAGEPLPGVIGADPRGTASAELGADGVAQVADRGAAIVDRLLAADALARERLLAALEAGQQALQRLASLRAARPKAQVPKVQTPAWLEHLEALHAGDYAAAAAAATRKWGDPAT